MHAKVGVRLYQNKYKKKKKFFKWLTLLKNMRGK